MKEGERGRGREREREGAREGEREGEKERGREGAGEAGQDVWKGSRERALERDGGICFFYTSMWIQPVAMRQRKPY